MSQSMGTNFQLPVIFDPFLNVEREIITVKQRPYTIHFPHVTLSKSERGASTKLLFPCLNCSSTQVLSRLMAEPQRNMELPETRALV